MKPLHFSSLRPLSVLLALVLCSTSALAGKSDDDKHGQGHGKKHKHSQVERVHVPVGAYFAPAHRTEVLYYYGEQHKAGRCPPGLRKKNNGCLPPGQAKQWKLGQPLPTTVVYYPVPQPVIVKIGPPPSGHRYVRVANDLLLIAIGTGMVVDAIEDLMAL